MKNITPQRGNVNCSVNECKNRQNNTSGTNIQFYTLPTSKFRVEQRQKWINWLKTVNGDDWKPKAHSKICSVHFINNKMSLAPAHDNYVPTIVKPEEIIVSQNNNVNNSVDLDCDILVGPSSSHSIKQDHAEDTENEIIMSTDSDHLVSEDSVEDVMDFLRSYEEQYGNIYPVFYQGSYSQALSDAKQELKFLLVYLHQDDSPDVDQWCRSTLANAEVIQFINTHTLFWTCNIRSGEGYKVSEELSAGRYPFLALIVLRDNKMKIVGRMERQPSPSELVKRTQTIIDSIEINLIQVSQDRAECSAVKSLKQHPDEAYQESDKQKDPKRQEETKLQEEQESGLIDGSEESYLYDSNHIVIDSSSFNLVKDHPVDDPGIKTALKITAIKSVQVFLPCKQHLFGTETIISCHQQEINGICHAGTQITTPENLPSLKVHKNKNTSSKSCGTTQTSTVDASVGPDYQDERDSKYLDGFYGYQSIRSNQAMLDVCGVSLETFNTLLHVLPLPEYHKKYKIQKKNRLVIFLMKMNNGMTFSTMAVIFGVNRTTISRVFFSMLQLLRARCAKFVFWPPKDVVQETMPEVFKQAYPDCRVIIDCFELRVERPPSIGDRVRLYSHYKKNYTTKVLIGCTPGGLVSFISKCFGGRTSDTQITVASGLLNLLEPGDLVLADKGFPGVQTILDKDGKKSLIVMPPFLTNGFFSPEEVNETYGIAKLRIHIERIIQRCRTYRIVEKLPHELYAHADDILFMVAVLVNLQPPIINEEKKNNADTSVRE